MCFVSVDRQCVEEERIVEIGVDPRKVARIFNFFRKLNQWEVLYAELARRATCRELEFDEVVRPNEEPASPLIVLLTARIAG